MLVRPEASVSVSSGRRPHACLVHCLIGRAFSAAPLPASPGIIKVAVSFKSCVVFNTEAEDTDTSTEQKILPGNLDNTVFTRQSDPFKVDRVDAVLAELSHPFPHLGLSSDLRSFSADILLSYYIALVS